MRLLLVVVLVMAILGPQSIAAPSTDACGESEGITSVMDPFTAQIETATSDLRIQPDVSEAEFEEESWDDGLISLFKSIEFPRSALQVSAPAHRIPRVIQARARPPR